MTKPIASNTSTQHTPVPWRIGESGSTIFQPNGLRLVARTESLSLSDGGPETEIANGLFIVRACNAHEALVEALREIANGADDYPWLLRSQIQGKARAALALVEGRVE